MFYESNVSNIAYLYTIACKILIPENHVRLTALVCYYLHVSEDTKFRIFCLCKLARVPFNTLCLITLSAICKHVKIYRNAQLRFKIYIKHIWSLKSTREQRIERASYQNRRQLYQRSSSVI